MADSLKALTPRCRTPCPSLFLVLVLCLWTAFTILPYSMLHICIFSRKVPSLECFPRGSVLSQEIYQVSDRVSEMVFQ
eukprot:c33395_g1_i1 orf=42-275(+)